VKERKLSIVGVAGERKYCREEKLVPINIALLLIVGECRTKHRWIAKTNCKDGLQRWVDRKRFMGGFTGDLAVV
jgi:hypothetical protein